MRRWAAQEKQEEADALAPSMFGDRNSELEIEEVGVEGTEAARREILEYDGNGGRRYRATGLSVRTDDGRDVQVTAGDFADRATYDTEAVLDSIRLRE